MTTHLSGTVPASPAPETFRIRRDADIDANLIKQKKVAVIGYGSQGHAHALNLKDSGVAELRVGLRPGSATAAAVEKAGISVADPAAAAAWADVVMILTPDEVQGKIYRDHLHNHMKPGTALAFAHGFNVHFGFIRPRADLDVFLVAPKGPGRGVRAAYEAGGGLPCLVAVHQDMSGKAFDLALSYAGAIGAGRAGILETSFREECETDLFGEQAVLCGGISHLVQAGFETLVEAGYAPEMAYFECLHETKLIVDLLYEKGLAGMRAAISNTAEYGDYVSGPRVISAQTKAEMRRILQDIQSGKFARAWMDENNNGLKNFSAAREQGAAHLIETVGARLRAAMPGMIVPRQGGG